MELVHAWIPRERPFATLGFSSLIPAEASSAMPSGHAAFYFSLAFAVFLMNRRWGTVYFALAAVIGVARVAAGVHYPMDILVGAAIGLVSGYVVWKLLAPYLPPKAEPEAAKPFVSAG